MNYPVTPYAYYTLNADALLTVPSGPLPPDDLQINILVSKKSQLCPELYQGISLLQNECMISFTTPFLAETINEKNLLSDIFCLTSLGNIASNKMLPIFVTDEKDFSANVIFVMKYLTEQGIDGIEMPFFLCQSEESWQRNKSCLFLTLLNYPNNALIKNYPIYEGAKLVIINIDKNEFNKSDLNKWTKMFFECNKTDVIRVDLNTCLMGKVFDQEITLWKRRTLVYQDFLSISKAIQEKEYYEILDWYKTEYEILPLWYKRFGHIIKVIMGKRSFRSLFDDNVKKYKD